MRIDYATVPHAKQTNADGVNRYARRVEHILSRNADRIEGKKVLDLACATGVLSYPMLMLGASDVTGVEARPQTIEKGREAFAASPFEDRMTFVCADLFEYLDTCAPGDFDVIVCAGFLYHTVRQADFFREMKRLGPETVFLDTSIAKNYWWFGLANFGRPPALFLYTENAALARSTIDLDGVVYWPTASYIETMARNAGYEPKRVNFREQSNGNWAAMADYRKGLRAAWLCERTHRS